MASPQRNKEAAMAFYDLAFNQNRPAEAVERYAGGPETSANDNGMF